MVVQSARSLIKAIRLAVKVGLRSNPTCTAAAPNPKLIAKLKLIQQRLTSIQKPRIKLNIKFTNLLDQLSSSTNPILKGAKNVFLQSNPSSIHSASSFATTSTSSSPILRNLSSSTRNAFKSSSFSSSSSSRFNNFGASIKTSTIRTPFKPSMRNAGGLGLQTARNFSSGGARGFDLIVTNAPLALRALGNELEKQGNGKSLKAQSRGIRRLGEKGVKKSQRLALERSLRSSTISCIPLQKLTLNSSVSQERETRHQSLESSSIQIGPETTREEIRSEFDRYWKPSSTSTTPIDIRDQTPNQDSEGPHQGIQTNLHLALDPNLSSILLCQPLRSSRSSSGNHPLIDESLIDSLQDVQDSFKDHRIFLSRILRVLRELKVLTSYDPAILSFENFNPNQSKDSTSLQEDGKWNGERSLNPTMTSSSSSFSLEIKFKGWKKEEILEMLKVRIGEGIVEEFKGLLLFVEIGSKQVHERETYDGNQLVPGSNGIPQSQSELGSGSAITQVFNDSQSKGQESNLSMDFSESFIMPTIPISMERTNDLDLGESFQSILQQEQSNHQRRNQSPDSFHSDQDPTDSSSSSTSDLSSPRSEYSSSLTDSIVFGSEDDHSSTDEEGEEVGLEDSLVDSRIGF